LGRKSREKKERRSSKVLTDPEFDELIRKGFGVAGTAMRERLSGQSAILRENPSDIKYSDLIKEFITPLLSGKEDKKLMKFLVFLGVTTWNSAIIKTHNQKQYDDLRVNIINELNDLPAFDQIFDALVQRKLLEFEQYDHLINDFEVHEYSNGNFEISVAHLPSEHIYRSDTN